MLQSGASEHAQVDAIAHASTAPEFRPIALWRATADPLFDSSASSGITARQPVDEYPGSAVVGGSKRQNRARSAPASLERKLEAKVKDVEAQLSQVNAQLAQLRHQQQELEIQNQVLENKTQTHSSLSPTAEDVLLWKGDAAWHEQANSSHDHAWALNLTVRQNDCYVTVNDLCQLPLAKLTKLYTVLAVSMHNPNLLYKLDQSRMDLGCAVQETASDECFRRLVVAMSYSKEQIQDLLHLRRLFYGRQGVLDRQRRDLVGKLSSNEAMVMTDSPPQSNYSVLTSISHELRANAAEEHCLRLQCCCACFRGIHTSKQCATGMVHMYPFMLQRGRLFVELAAQIGEPSVRELMTGLSKSDAQHMADWQHVVTYLDKLSLNHLDMHCPLLGIQQ
ncbi:MAG: hypothetical protein FRX49_05867 [Trebouxia sp. A1-2]|nr:MAG: hypothetical protein FRX49_05867 [Trebouxia sp. A1-2]